MGRRRAIDGVRAGPVIRRPASVAPIRKASTGARFPDATGYALLAGAIFLAYWPAVQGTFVWDDSGHITRPELQSWHGLWRIWFQPGATQQYYPLLHAAFWLEYHLWGYAATAYHVTNLLLHAASAWLVVRIVRRLALPGAWLAGFVFALHPVLVEAVAWIAEQKSTLSGVFCLGSLLAYLHFDKTRRKSQYWLAAGLFVLALLSKTVTATLPAVLLVIFWWQRGRIAWRRDVLPLLPWFGLSLTAGLYTAWVERTFIGAEGAEFTLAPLQRFLLAGRAIWFYATKVVCPANLVFTYPRWNLDPGVWWQYLFPAGVLAVAAALGWMARRRRGPLASFLIYCGTLFPVLGFFNVYPFRFSYVADHFQYLASLAIIIPAASAIALAAHGGPLRKSAEVILVLVLGVLTWRQSGFYRNGETLYRATLAGNPGSWMAHQNLGSLLLAQGRRQEAIAEYETALRLKSDYAEAHHSLGNALFQVPGRLPDAIAHYKAALQIQPDYAEAHTNLANALLQTPGHVPEAIAHYEAALRIKPDDADVHNDLGNALLQVPGRLPYAIAEFQTALRINPGDAIVHFNLATTLVRAGRIQDAIAEYEVALRLKPDLEQARQMVQRLRAVPQ